MSFEEQQRQEADYGRDRVGHLMPLFRRPATFWHRCSEAGLRGITGAGAILPNTGGRNAWGYGGTSYGQKIGAVHLFDFTTPAEADVLAVARKWLGYLTDKAPVTVWLEIDRFMLDRQLVEQQPPFRGCQSDQRIPVVEAWHKGPIPLSAVRRVYAFRESEAEQPPVDLGAVDQAAGAIASLGWQEAGAGELSPAAYLAKLRLEAEQGRG